MLTTRRFPVVLAGKRKRTNGDGGSARRRQRIGEMMKRASQRRALMNPRVGGLLGIETKFLDAPRTNVAMVAPTDAAGAEVNPSSIVTGCLSAPAQGDGPTNRDGSRIAIKSILVQGAITAAVQSDQADMDQIPSFYVALVLDKQTNGATLNSEDVFSNPQAEASANSGLVRNMSFTQRFKVLAKVRLRAPMITAFSDSVAVGTGSMSGYHIPWTLKHKFTKPLRVTFTTGSTTADVANVTDNSLHIIAYATGLSTVPLINYISRMRFVG